MIVIGANMMYERYGNLTGLPLIKENLDEIKLLLNFNSVMTEAQFLALMQYLVVTFALATSAQLPRGYLDAGTKHFTPAIEKKTAQEAADLLSRAIDKLNDLGPYFGSLVRFYEADPEAERETSYSSDFQMLLHQMEHFHEFLQARVNEYTPPSERPADLALETLVERLADVWVEFKGTEPGYTPAAIKKPGRNDQLSYGPFVRLCEAVASMAIKVKGDKVRNMVKRVVARRKAAAAAGINPTQTGHSYWYQGPFHEAGKVISVNN